MNTLNPSELAHFQALSPTWWEERGPFKILHEITPYRIAFLKEKAGIHFQIPDDKLDFFKGLRILDVGCGGGLFCEPLARLGAEVVGIDPLYENITLAKNHATAMDLPITYLPYAIENLPKDISPFDIIIASEIIEHVDNFDDFLKACVSHLSPLGGLMITTFNQTMKSYLFGILMAEYVLKWAPRGTHSWEKFISPEKLSRKLQHLSFPHQELTGLQYFPLSQKWGFSPSLDVNYFLWATQQKQ
jgi:2-polyprenyl-6-hydroxyphenyl methylase/3-demethylubiquinone-9 3-methyltransferase